MKPSPIRSFLKGRAPWVAGLLMAVAAALAVGSPGAAGAAEGQQPVHPGPTEQATHPGVGEGSASHAGIEQGQGGPGGPKAHQASGHEGGGGHEAGAHGTPSISPTTLGLQLLNFAVLLFILIKFGGGAINKALAARHQQLKADLASAAELRAIAEAKLSKQEARLASLENEIAAMRRGIKAEADAEKGRLIAAAEERADRIKTETTFLVGQQVREAETRLRREAAETALKAAEEILRRAIVPGDQQRLLDTFVNDVEQPVLPSAGRAA